MTTHAKIFLGIACVLALGGGGYWYYAQGQENKPRPCTMEAKLCPDGSVVGRTGPNCEFADCPAVASTSSGTDTDSQGILPYQSGVRGTVMIGPTCPVETIPIDPNCADRPYQTMVAIFRVSDPVHAFVITESAADGTFSASLPPGEYILGAGESNHPQCAHPEISVGVREYVSANISCDSGIR